MIKSKENIIVAISVLLVLFIIIIYPSENSESKFGDLSNENVTQIGVVFNKHGLGDKSFNDLCFEGILRAQDKLNIEFDYYESKSEEDYETIAREYASSKKYDLIISIGFEQEEAVKKVSKEFLNQKFTLVDSRLNLSNVSSINTFWTEQTFLNGVIAGLLMKEDKLQDEEVSGIILGMDMKHLREGAIGFEAGIRYINPDAKVIVGVVDDFSNPAKAKEMALSMYRKGAKYIQHIAGESGFGVFAAAKEVDKYAFGIDGNQNFFEPDYIVATAIRHADDIIYNEIESVVKSTWSPGMHSFGIKENVIGYEIAGSNVEIPEKTIQVVEEIKNDIVEGELYIPSTYEELEIWTQSNQYKK
ncbi:BMP family lipoprotein [Romboutsia sp. 1001713B170207_170306_H8]|uniref:BMP family lipoprotein n=1 Tax=Romboutsia sp. 1001713B170207_170306_H8 TaxID=2787112 RepID=UPI000820FBFB|nr:Purine nucleoside receptor A [uncultured Clostridium sp.]